jgi:hypothetical protein
VTMATSSGRRRRARLAATQCGGGWWRAGRLISGPRGPK